MKDVLSGKLYRDQDEFNIVLNSAQKGVCIGRKSLTPAFCDLHKIWHNNSNAYAVSLCRHKYHTGCLLEYFGYTCPKSWSYNYAYGWLLNHRPDQGARVIAKLNYETSSIGLDSNNIFIYKNLIINQDQLCFRSLNGIGSVRNATQASLVSMVLRSKRRLKRYENEARYRWQCL